MFYINNHDDDDDNNNNNNNNFQWTNQLRAPSYHKVQSQEYEILEDNPASQPSSRGSISFLGKKNSNVAFCSRDSSPPLLFRIALAALSLTLNKNFHYCMSQAESSLLHR